MADVIWRARCKHAEMRTIVAPMPEVNRYCPVCGVVPWERWEADVRGWGAGVGSTVIYMRRSQAKRIADEFMLPLVRRTVLRMVRP